MEIISNSGLSAKKLAKKTKKAMRILDKKNPDFENALSVFSAKTKISELKRPKNNWQLFLSEHRETLKKEAINNPVINKMSGAEHTKSASAIWNKMTDDEKKPYNDTSAQLSSDYKIKLAEINRCNVLANNSSDENSDQNKSDSDDNSEKSTRKKAKKPLDLKYWEDSETLEFIRYTKGDESWEYVTKNNHFIIRESINSVDFKIFENEMKSEKAVLKSVANKVEKKELEAFEYIGDHHLTKSDLI